MEVLETISVTLPPDVVACAQEIAQREHRTVSDLFREALRRYITDDSAWQEVLGRVRANAKAAGVATAMAGAASHIVSGDRHLLSLSSHAGIPILRVREFLDLLAIAG